MYIVLSSLCWREYLHFPQYAFAFILPYIIYDCTAFLRRKRKEKQRMSFESITCHAHNDRSIHIWLFIFHIFMCSLLSCKLLTFFFCLYFQGDRFTKHFRLVPSVCGFFFVTKRRSLGFSLDFESACRFCSLLSCWSDIRSDFLIFVIFKYITRFLLYPVIMITRDSFIFYFYFNYDRQKVCSSKDQTEINSSIDCRVSFINTLNTWFASNFRTTRWELQISANIKYKH